MIADFPIRRVFLRAAPGFTVARAALGCTLYLANGVAWAREGLPAALRAFRRHVEPDALRWYSVSTGDRWHPVGAETFPLLDDVLPLPWNQLRPRHLFQVRLVDDTSAPSTAFIYRELDEDRAPSAGYVQCVVPFDHPVDDFVALVIELLQCGLAWSGVGGYLASWSIAEKPTSFVTLRGWCRRYHGLDVQDPDAMAWAVHRGLPGVNWLTFLGKPFFAAHKLDPTALLGDPWGGDTDVAALPSGLLVRAGALPTVGDLNTLAHPADYAEVARRLDPHVLAAPPAFPWWPDEDETARWLHRLARPEQWP